MSVFSCYLLQQEHTSNRFKVGACLCSHVFGDFPWLCLCELNIQLSAIMVTRALSNLYEAHHNVWVLLSISIQALESTSILHIHLGEYCQGHGLTIDDLDSESPPSISWVIPSSPVLPLFILLDWDIKSSEKWLPVYPICISYQSSGYLLRNLEETEKYTRSQKKIFSYDQEQGSEATELNLVL